MAAVPVVDIAGWSNGGSDEDRAGIAAAVDAACAAVGFVQVTGHGIPDQVSTEALSASDRFFGLPVDQKLRFRPPSPDVNRGYAPLGSESLADSLGRPRPPDLFEAYSIGMDGTPDGPPPHTWPTELDDWSPALWRYFGQAHRVSTILLDIFAQALGLPSCWFRPFTDQSTLTLRTIRYDGRPADTDLLPDQRGMGEHTDGGVVTVLFADPVPGLQVLLDERWQDVVPAAGAVIVNIGDLLARWTNDRWRSTPHRVVSPKYPSGTVVRRSMTFFNDANHDAVIECLPTCRSATDPPRHEPVVAGEHLTERILAARTMRTATTVQAAGDRLTLG